MFYLACSLCEKTSASLHSGIKSFCRYQRPPCIYHWTEKNTQNLHFQNCIDATCDLCIFNIKNSLLYVGVLFDISACDLYLYVFFQLIAFFLVLDFFSFIYLCIGYRPCPRCSSSGKTCTCESRHRPRGAREVFRYARAGLSTGWTLRTRSISGLHTE